MIVTVIIPAYNEEHLIVKCLVSLTGQTYPSLEIIVINDGSTDRTEEKVRQFMKENHGINMNLICQPHLGPALARNRGVKEAAGDIIVFADADMTFDKNFVSALVQPVLNGDAKGTFSKEEYLDNPENVWSLCWNINRFKLNGWPIDAQVYTRILPQSYPDKQPVFRAIKKEEFIKAGGFDSIGYTDDWTLARKLGYEAVCAPGAKMFHSNPDSPAEIFRQAAWIGGNEFLSGSILRRGYNLIRYSFPVSLLRGIITSLRMHLPQYILFKLIYDAGIFRSVLLTPKNAMK